MKKWLFLTAAVLLEVTASLSLSAAQHHPGWYALVVAGYVGSFAALAQVLALLPLGVAYGIWGAAGVTLTAVFGALLFGDPLNPVMIGGIVLVIAGVLLVELGQQAAENKAKRMNGDTP